MRNSSPSLFLFPFFMVLLSPVQAETENQKALPANTSEVATVFTQADHSAAPTSATRMKSDAAPVSSTNAQHANLFKTNSKFLPFTGKITKNKVRMRLQPTYDGSVLRELNRNDLIVVQGETEDFYAIQPPSDSRGYVFRTFVLDNVIEGNRVNIRIKPELNAPVIAQLNSGDRVVGSITPSNNKWMEIKLPENTHFFIAKEYIEKAGDAGYKTRLERKHEEVNQLLASTANVSKLELQKPFEQINIQGMKTTYQHIMNDYPEFPNEANQAKEALLALQEAYTAKKLSHLENQSRMASTSLETNKKLEAELQAQKDKITLLEQQIEHTKQLALGDPTNTSAAPKNSQLPANMSVWLPIEEKLFNSWSYNTGNSKPKDFYDEQKKQSFVLKGIVDPYLRPVKNKPGDFMLLSSATRLPIAFLYSTHLNLQEYVGHEISVVVSPRNNNNFAFPAYFVLSME